MTPTPITTAPERSRRRRVLRTGAGLGAAAAMLTSAAVATAQPTSATHPARRTAVTMRAAAKRPDSTIQVSTRSLRAGAQITITGDAPTDARSGSYITLQSMVFASSRQLDGIPALRTQVSAQGTYRIVTVLRQGLKPTTYAIAGSFQGKPFSQVATIRITPGPDSTVVIARATAMRGGSVRVSGDAPTYAPTGRTVTLSSRAFTHSVNTQVSAQGTYQVNASISRTITPGSYTVTGSYQGHRFSNTATITVR